METWEKIFETKYVNMYQVIRSKCDNAVSLDESMQPVVTVL